MTPIQIISAFFAVLAIGIGCASFAEQRVFRVIGGVFALGWAGLMFVAAAEVKEFDYNIWYSAAAHKLLLRSADALEDGRTQEVLREWRKLEAEIEVNYEKRGNFMQIACEASERLKQPKMPNNKGARQPATRPESKSQ